MNRKELKKEMIYWAKLLNERAFTTARNGNLSCKMDDGTLLISAHDAYLGFLKSDEILCVDNEGKVLEGTREITSEKNLHLAIQRQFKEMHVVIHAHPPFTTAFFHYFGKLDIVSFEAQFYLGEVTVVPQDTPAVTDMKPVLESLENSNIVVLKNHGIVTMGEDFKQAFSLIELLEEQAKVGCTIQALTMPLGKNHARGITQQAKGERLSQKKYKLLSKEHGDKLTTVINNDTKVQELGKKYDLTCSLAVKNQETHEVMCFHYNKGKVTSVDASEAADFVIAGTATILTKVFNREIDPFVAVTQKKVKTKGDFSKMSKWYPVMVRTFALWEEAPVE